MLKQQQQRIKMTLRDSSQTVCPFCRSPALDSERLVGCVDCGTAHHRACWEEHEGGCAVFGCSGSDAQLASLVLGEGQSDDSGQMRRRSPASVAPGVAANLDRLAFEMSVEPRSWRTFAQAWNGFFALVTATVMAGAVLGRQGNLLNGLLVTPFLLPFWIVGAWVAWIAWTHTSLRIDRRGIEITRTLFGVKRTHRYPVDEQMQLERYYVSHGEDGDTKHGVRLTIGGRKVRFGHGLGEAEHKQIIKMIRDGQRRFSTSGKTNRQVSPAHAAKKR